MTKVYDTATDLITFARSSSATYLDSDGVLKTAVTDIPRIEYGSDGSLKGLLIEEERSNLFKYSEDFTATTGAWTGTNVVPPANDATGPDNVMNSATTLTEDTSASAQHYISETVTGMTAGTYTSSIFVKMKDTSSRTKIRLRNLNFVPTNNHGDFDLVAGTVTKGSAADNATIENVGNGWFRCSVTSTSTGQSAAIIRVFLLDDSGNLSYTGDGTSGILIYGAQLEEGSFPTSYIPTSGSQSTRSPDIASIPVSAFGYNQDAGTFVADYTPVTKQNQYAISVTTSFNYMALLWGNAGNAVRFQVTAGSATSAQLNTLTGTVAGTRTVHAGAYAANDFAACNDGGTVLTDTLGDVPSGLVQMKIGSEFGDYLNGHIKSIQYYPRRLTNIQLQELTS